MILLVVIARIVFDARLPANLGSILLAFTLAAFWFKDNNQKKYWHWLIAGLVGGGLSDKSWSSVPQLFLFDGWQITQRIRADRRSAKIPTRYRTD